MAEANGDGEAAVTAPPPALPAPRRDPYEVLGVSRNATSAQIKYAYRKMALQLHPDKNVGDPAAPERFREISYSYGILIDPEKRKQYDTAGFEWVDDAEINMDLDITQLGTFSTMFFAIFSKLGVPFKTSISIDVLEDALKGTIAITPLALGKPLEDKVEKQRARFYGVNISKSQAEDGVVVRVTSASQSKFKLLYFTQEEDGSLQLVSQEDSAKAGKITAAGMYFLDFQVYRFDATANALAMAKNPDAAFFKRLEGLTPCEISQLDEGTHVFAVYGDNFFRSANYTIEVVCAKDFPGTSRALQQIERELVAKKTQLAEFEAEYLEALSRFNAVTSRYAQEKQTVKDLMKLWHKVQGSFSSVNQASKAMSDDDHNTIQEEPSSSKEWWNTKNWFGLKK